MDNSRPIPKFDAVGEESSVAQRWRRYLIEVEAYFAGMNVTDAKIKKGKLLYFAGEEVRIIWSTLEEEARGHTDTAVKAIQITQAQDKVARAKVDLATLTQHMADMKTHEKTAANAASQQFHADGKELTAEEKKERAVMLVWARYAVVGVQHSKDAAAAKVDLATKEAEGVAKIKDEYEVCVEALSTYFAPSKNYMFERFNFHKIIPNQGESNCQYLTRLKAAAVNCNFSNQDIDILGMLVLHTKSNDLRKELLKAGDSLNYLKARELARSLETADTQAKAMLVGSQISSVATFSSDINRIEAMQQHHGGGIKKKTCFGCGKEGHFMYDYECRARGHQCSTCGRKGHYSKYCRRDSFKKGGGSDSESDTENKKGSKGHGQSRINYMTDGNMMDSVTNSANVFLVSDSPADQLDSDVTIQVGGVDIDFVIDSAAINVNVLDKKTWELCKLKNMKGECVPKEKCKPIFVCGYKEPLQVMGMCRSTINFEGKKQEVELYVIDWPGKPLLDRRTAMSLGLLAIGRNANNLCSQIHQVVEPEQEASAIYESYLFGPQLMF